MIVSGNRVGFLDPQERIWKAKSGYSKKLTVMQQDFPNHLTPLNGIEKFSSTQRFSSSGYSKTLFRFPLRNRESNLSKTLYDPARVMELMSALRDEAKLLLLFLKSVETVEIYKISKREGQNLQFRVEIGPRHSHGEISQHSQVRMLVQTSDSYLQHHEVSESVIDATVKVTDQMGQISTSHWLIANRVGSKCGEVRSMAKRQCILPWVGTALELERPRDHENGRIFCFLPMPCETCTDLPVHVNGTFSLNDDRRTLKWPGRERRNDLSADWNKILVEKVFPSCYVLLLKAALSRLTAKEFYATLPDVHKISSTNWEGLLHPLYSNLFEHACLWSSRKKWVKVCNATFLPEHESIKESVKEVITSCGHDLVDIPPNMWRALDLVYNLESLKSLSPKLTRCALKNNTRCYTSITDARKLDLLQYCLSDRQYLQLIGLQLLPLANGVFKSFKEATSVDSFYVCTKKCPQELLPNVGHRLVNLPDHPSLHNELEWVAFSKQTQLQLLDSKKVADLLPLIFPKDWDDEVEVPFEESGLPKDWLRIFWNWVSDHDLKLFEGLFIIPIASGGRVSTMKLKVNSGVVYIQSFEKLSKDMQNILHKLDVRYTLCKHVPYLRHQDLFNYLNPFKPYGVLTAIEDINSNSSLQRVSFSKENAQAFQKFIASSQYDLSENQEVIENLNIFLPLGSQTPVSLATLSTSKKVIMEPHGFGISHNNLPSNLVVLSLSQNHQEIIKVSSLVVFPSSIRKFLIDIIFPLIRSGTFKPSSKLSLFMQEIFDVFPKFKSPVFIEGLKTLPFLPCSPGFRDHKSLQDLYDPSQGELERLYSGEEVFPLPPFDKEEYLLRLRACGLKTSVSEKDLYNILTEVSGRDAIMKVDKNAFIRAQAVFSYIRSHKTVLNGKVFTGVKFMTLEQAIVELASKKSILPIQSSPSSEEYPMCLPWKGAKYTSHLTTMNSLVLPCSSKTIDTLPNIVGSKMYIVFCPSELCSVLCPEPPIEHVISHFMEIIKYKKDFENTELEDLVYQIYGYLTDNLQFLFRKSKMLSIDLHQANWIWIGKLHKFVKPSDTCISRGLHQQFPYDLSPILHVLTEKHSKFSSLFIRFGAHKEINTQLLISVLSRIKDNSHSTSNDRAWAMVSHILNWITNHGKTSSREITTLDDLYVPIESQSLYPQLVKTGDVVYTDLKYLKSVQKSKKNLKFVHEDYAHLASCLELTPLSKELNISDYAFDDVGQSEPLVKRLKNILRDYKDGLTIIKELLQNADDAGASEVNICYDACQHSQDTDNLMFEGMAKCHGPALIVQNNQTFSDEDFVNIQQLAGATKQDQPLKIGKFGVGFCSVYHITDVPSFISRDWLYIFDPTLEYLEGAVTNPMKPGKKLRFTDECVRCSSQMDPYKGLFNFKPNVPYQDTMFRLPFRGHPSSISSKKYGKKQVDKLISDIKEAGPKLLLFMKNLKEITFSRRDNDVKKCSYLLKISRSNINRSLVKRSHRCDKLSTSIVNLKVSEKMLTGKWSSVEHIYLVAEQNDVENNQVSAVACSLEKLSSAHTFTYQPKEVRGEVFCFLPLHLETGLPVHVSANFAVMNDRRGIHYSDSVCKSDESQFNVRLMEESIPLSYHKLLTTLRDLCQEGKISVNDYKFHTFWPLEESLKTHNPWDCLIPKLYAIIATSELCYSKSVQEWLCIDDAKLLSPNILQKQTTIHVINVMKVLKYPLIHLPVSYHCPLATEVSRSTINEKEFISIFFENISKFSSTYTTRNNILLSLVTTYAIRPSPELQSVIKNNKCIPCTPQGQILKKCGEVVHRESEFQLLYDPEDHMHPIKTFSQDIVSVTLRSLGAITSRLPWHMVIERANTVKELYASNTEKALMRTKLLMSCININLRYSECLAPEANELTEISFLPILHKPKGYPRELEWAGDSQTLLCSSQVLLDTYKHNSKLVGSSACLVSQVLPSKGGCGSIPSSVASALKITSSPSVRSVLKHLENMTNVYNSCTQSAFFTSWITKACDDIYKYFEERLSKGTHHNVLKRLLSRPGLLWNGKEFIHPEQIALNWKHDGPHLYALPSLLQHGKGLLQDYLKFQEHFSTDQILQALKEMKEFYGQKRLQQRDEKIIVDIAIALQDSLGEDEELSDDTLCYLPDENLCMRDTRNLAWNDTPWFSMEQEHYFIYDNIPRPVALKLGVKPIRSKALDMYSSPCDDFAGVPFGQGEELTQRIRNILDTYTHDETVLKELLQNADDAKATKLYFILDERTHGTKRVFSDEWKDLQGPALLVWNDKGFTEDDMKGIQKLGLGSKRSKAESIGQYGIGFNVVYHLTDCPSFFTNGKTLCVLDPHCRYMPGATTMKPGRRLDNVDEKFWSNLSDLKTAYLHGGLSDCPNEISRSGTLFRFPLRSTSDLVKKSKLIEEDIKSFTQPLSAWRMAKNMKEWAPKMKEALIFLKHVTELKFILIKDCKERPAVMRITHHYKSVLDKKARDSQTELQEKTANFTNDDGMKKPFSIDYNLTLTEKVPKKEEELWLVQQGVGDINNPSQHWEYLSHIKPMHGLAAQIRGASFTPKFFCFLPLPQESKLPVHVNGNFILDSSSRSTLWQSRDTSSSDDRKKWNDRLIEALGSSYAELLMKCKSTIVNKKAYTRLGELLQSIEDYYNLFPKWMDFRHSPESEMKELAQLTLKSLSNQMSSVLCTVNEATRSSRRSVHCHSSAESEYVYSIEWHPVLNDDASKQIYFWEEDEELQLLRSILKRIGIVLSAAPMWLKEHFDYIDIKIPQALPESVYEYYTQYFHQISPAGTFPVHVSNTAFENVESMSLFLQYILKEEYLEEGEGNYSSRFIFPSLPFGYPLLLTADKQVRLFDEKEKVIASQYSHIFKQRSDIFLHAEMLKLKLDDSYFVQPNKENWDLVQNILKSTLSTSLSANRVKNATSHINTEGLLKPLWQCIHNDGVFREHLEQIVKHWALILSRSNELFKYHSNLQFLMPVVPPRKPRSTSTANFDSEAEERLHSAVFDILKKHQMPVVDRIVLKAKTFCPNFSEPKSILANLYHLYNDIGLDSLLADRDVDAHIDKLFSYFRKIHFAQDQTSLHNIKHLPLFKNIDGRYCSLTNEAYFWPDDICMDGIEIILSQTPAIFLKHHAPWTNLTDSDTLGIKSFHALTFYIQFVFPHFHLLNDAKRISHLKHIKDTLFTMAEDFSEMTHQDSYQWMGNEFISKLKNLPIIRTEDGTLLPACKFYNPRNKVFVMFPDQYAFPPEDLCSDNWLRFLKKIGLQTKPSKEDFTEFCIQVSKGKHSQLEKASDVLLTFLFKTHSWHTDEDFLQGLNSIPFIQVEKTPDLDWIQHASTAGIHVIQQGRKRISLVSSRDCASDESALLIWTILPVVKLPKVSHPPNLKDSKRNEIEQFLMQNLGICIIPSIPQVTENLRNISASRFSKFKLFENYNIKSRQDIDLFTVVVKNVKFLARNDSQYQSASKLNDIPFIPVSKDYFGGDLSRPVLVCPLQVVISIPSEFKLPLHPCLLTLPKELLEFVHFFMKVGVNHTTKLENIFYVFNLIHSHFKMPLDPNTVESVKALLKLLHKQLSAGDTDDTYEGEHYLPSYDHCLYKSTNLLYDERGCYNKESFDFSSVPKYSMMSLLCQKSDEMREYSFKMRDLISQIPKSFRPIPLSSCCTNKIDRSCKPENQLSAFAKRLENIFQISNFAEAARLLLMKSGNERASSKFSASLKKFVESIEVYSVPELKVNIYFNLSCPPIKIGSAHMDFLICRDKSDQLTLYIDSRAAPFRRRLLESLTKSIVTEVLRMSGVEIADLRECDEVMDTLLKIEAPEDIKAILDEYGISSLGIIFQREFDYHLDPELGEPIPDEFHHRLYSDIYNNFKPQEFVGYEIRENQFIYARVEYKVRREEEEEEEELDRYVIRLNDREEEDSKKMVSVIYLHKILRLKDVAGSSNAREVERYDPDSDSVKWWASVKDRKLKEILSRIYEELRRASRIRDKDEKRKALKAMYLKWHPDKNRHPLATKAFQFLKRQIQRMEDGLEMEDPGENWESKPSTSRSDWEDIINQRMRGWDNERAWWSRNDDLSDIGSSRITVSPDQTKAEVWIKQAGCDVRAMRVMYTSARRDDTLCAHVCFLSHQVAEKTLKAGMYAKNGLHPDALQHHSLIGHAKALEQVDTAMIGLSELARRLEGKDYYLKSRYPNRYTPHQVPSECLHLSEAEEAVKISTDMYNKVVSSLQL